MSPTYDYSGETRLHLEDLDLIPNNRIITTRYYSGEKLVLVSNTPNTPVPIKVLWNAAPTATPISIPQERNTIRITNMTNKNINIYINGSTEYFTLNCRYSGEGTFIELDNNKNSIGQIVASGEGVGIGVVQVFTYNKFYSAGETYFYG